METPSKRRALGVLDANINASPLSPLKSYKATPNSELRKRPLDLFPGTVASPIKRPCLPKSQAASSGLQPSPVLSQFPLDDNENLPPPIPSVRGMIMHGNMFEASPDASRAFLSECASSPVAGMVSRPRPRTMSRQEARQKAEALKLRLGLANYKLKTGQTDVPLDQLQMKPCRTNFRHSISFPSASVSSIRTTAIPVSSTFSHLPRQSTITEIPQSYSHIARRALGALPDFNTGALMSSSPVQPSPFHEREERQQTRILPRMVPLPTPASSQEAPVVKRIVPIQETPVRKPVVNPDLTGDETESEPGTDDEKETPDDEKPPMVTPKRQTIIETTDDDDSGAATGLLFLARSA